MDENKIIKKLLEHDEEFKKIHREMDDRFNEVLTGQDKILIIVKRLDQERIFTFEYIKRLEKDINKVKKVLKIA